MVLTGLDQLTQTGFARLRGQRIGVVCNQASVDANLDHILDLLLPLHLKKELDLVAVFGPQHGLSGHTQDNMIEWEGAPSSLGFRIHSLYGEHREPTEAMLEGIDLMVIDLQDVGARYYTFVWTMALCVKACRRLDIPVLILDRPNPIGGLRVEGPVMRPEFASFVGLHPLPPRHGMTIGEIARYLASSAINRAGKSADESAHSMEILPLQGWRREMNFDDTGLPWVMPSPNMPTVDTAFVYPGMCLLEGTNLSEGRGTTRPFETVGAPYLQAGPFCQALNSIWLPGVKFRPIQFEPTFNKHGKQLCEGSFVHVLDRHAYEPVLTTIAILEEAVRQSNGSFAWTSGPYEYEFEKRPIDILAGNDWLAASIEGLTPLGDLREMLKSEALSFEPIRAESLIY